ncbi:TetR/AcrR family transcriptional regulator C-terminal domain-containing protein [Luteipulveratus mongoliensis]|uniref:TetR family transcriptional regulator n=1 Tax=Luteipulveratus mongoliensis TaxID=571913 RepID=A0A0K1JFJ3_9MICO|nr:TetR/AcrR family transcriptional regulator C-terminal domain-containing protein [Luteipulveratus mongoliensis]AKU15492.1 TetR family transcriptional regulator [Luteipulveratus mongoliensis]
MVTGRGTGEPKLVWERPEPPTRPAPSPLSRDRIVQSAIRLAEADGLEAVSLRKVAADLNAGPMRLYGYLATKEELLDLMADEMYGQLPRPESGASAGWRETLRFLAQGLRATAVEHEWFADLLGGRPHLGPMALDYLEASLAALIAAPELSDVALTVQVRDAVNAYVIGVVRSEIAERRAERSSGMDKQQWQAASGAYIAQALATGRYPTVGQVVARTESRDFEAKFNLGLEWMLDGVEGRLKG